MKVSRSKTQNKMKRTNQTTRRTAAVVLSALLIAFVTTAFAKTNDSKVDPDLQKSIEEYLEPHESDMILEMVFLDMPATIMILDEDNNLIYDAQAGDHDFDPVLEILLRRADYLMETDNTKYYRLYLN